MTLQILTNETTVEIILRPYVEVLRDAQTQNEITSVEVYVEVLIW